MFSDVRRLRCFVDWTIDCTIVLGRDIQYHEFENGAGTNYEAPDAGKH